MWNKRKLWLALLILILLSPVLILWLTPVPPAPPLPPAVRSRFIGFTNVSGAPTASFVLTNFRLSSRFLLSSLEVRTNGAWQMVGFPLNTVLEDYGSGIGPEYRLTVTVPTTNEPLRLVYSVSPVQPMQRGWRGWVQRWAQRLNPNRRFTAPVPVFFTNETVVRGAVVPPAPVLFPLVKPPL